ncbi:SRSF protein kinase 1-like isoform X4 [Amphibalanus amphitrite]|uniref:SRSF protein kinase 1-like isoform X4 n=1 Tax=Amphibalanus amphitrite TaxID=1232801 RepID=UPI001C921462|nr:SRSF protein kinase 1-like isoform X4 [Amphibalanus amphitrite]
MAPPEQVPCGRPACPPAVLQYAEQLVRDVITCAVRGLRGDAEEVRSQRHVSPRAVRDGARADAPAAVADVPQGESEPAAPRGASASDSVDRQQGPERCDVPAGAEPCDIPLSGWTAESCADTGASSPLRSSCCGLASLGDGLDVSDSPVPDPGLAASARSWKAASTGELHQLMACSAAAAAAADVELSTAFLPVYGVCAAAGPQRCPPAAAAGPDCAAASIDRGPPPRPPAPVRSQPAGPPQRPPPPTAVIPRCCADAYGRLSRPPERTSAAAAAALDPASSASEPFASCAGSTGSASGEEAPAASGTAAVSSGRPAPPAEPASEAASTDCDLLDVDELSLDQELAQVVSSAGRGLRDDVLDEILATAGRTESSRTETSVSEKDSVPSDDEDEGEEDEEIRGSDDDEQEAPSDYKPGGYHPVRIGDMFHGRYHVIRKLGWGHFSTVWLCWDIRDKRFVAMKVVKSACHYTETALDEIKLLKCVRDSDETDPFREGTVQLLDDFKIIGVNGTHVCMVFEVLGHNLLKLIIRSKYEGIPLENVKSIIKQVLEGLHYLHTKCQIIHTDIKPENVLLCVDEAHVRRLAADAAHWQKMGLKLPGSFMSTAPQHLQQPDPSTLSRNKKKRLKKKAAKQAKRLEQMAELTEQWEREQTEQAALRQEPAAAPADPAGADTGSAAENGSRAPAADSAPPAERRPPASPATPAGSQQNGSSAENCDSAKLANRQSLANMEEALIEHSGVGETVTLPYDLETAGEGGCNGHRTGAAGAKTTAAGPSDAPHTGDGPTMGDAEAAAPAGQSSPGPAPAPGSPAAAAGHSSSPAPGADSPASAGGPQTSAVPPALGPAAGDGVEADRDLTEVTVSAAAAEDDLDSSWVDIDEDGEEIPTAPVPSSSKEWIKLAQTPAAPSRGDSTEPAAGAPVKEERKPDPVHEVCEMRVKLADLGNACWTHHHFTEDIQTRQYRCLEVLLGAGYGPPADIWSTACMAFELATGDYLFEPHTGQDYSRDEDHIAHIIELAGDIPKHIMFSGKYSRDFFTKKGELRHITKLKPWALHEVLMDKYEWPEQKARAFADFLLPMLAFDPAQRATAADCLRHPWLTGGSDGGDASDAAGAEDTGGGGGGGS